MTTESKKPGGVHKQHQPDEFKNGYPVTKQKLEPIARILLIAVYDDNHIFSCLRGMRFIVKAIWTYVLQFNKHHWANYIDAYCVSCACISNGWRSTESIIFPQPQDININMMPFIMSDTFADTKLPNYLKGYHPIIKSILANDSTQKFTICYLTIHESMVDKDKTQRRPGLHIENPGNGGGNGLVDKDRILSWGRGYYDKTEIDGIYMSSSVDLSCAVYDCRINGAIGHLGNVEHLRSSLPAGQLGWNMHISQYKTLMRKNKLYWLTDRTPHESLPMREKGYRQFFRLVTHPVSVWYEQHSTANPNGVVPDTQITKIIKGNKFKQDNKNDKR